MTRDDVHLTCVELLVEGVPVQSQASYPVNFRLDLPAVAGNSVTVQFRATDGAGNVGASTPATLNLVADTETPVLVYSLPAAGGAAFLGHPFVLRFNEPVDTLPVDVAKVRLTHFGADAAAGGGDDSEYGLAGVTANGAVVNLHFPAGLTPGRCQLTLDAGAVKDRSGSATAQATSLTFDLLDTPPGSAVWISDADGNWDAPANWLHGRLPSQDDHVVLQRFGGKPKVTLNTSAIVKSLRAALPLTTTSRAGLTVLRDLTASEPVEIPARNIIVNGSATFEQALTINGGALEVSGRLETRGALTLEKGGALTLSGAGAQFVPTGSVQGAKLQLHRARWGRDQPARLRDLRRPG